VYVYHVAFKGIAQLSDAVLALLLLILLPGAAIKASYAVLGALQLIFSELISDAALLDKKSSLQAHHASGHFCGHAVKTALDCDGTRSHHTSNLLEMT
jgi:hypothetical protein